MKFHLLLVIMAGLITAPNHLLPAENSTANAINSVGIELLQKTGDPGSNALLAPYSIQSALAMAYAGASGDTRVEMSKVLHFPADPQTSNDSFARLDKELSKSVGAQPKKITLSIANRLYGEQSLDFRKEFLETLKNQFAAPLSAVDFKSQSENARRSINLWVADRTHQKITNLIPQGGVNGDTKLVLVNAIYFKAAWADPFSSDNTQPRPFHPADGQTFNVNMMSNTTNVRYARRWGYSIIAIPYAGSDVQLVILLPDQPGKLASLEKKLTAGMLTDCASIKSTEVQLYLPKFTFRSAGLELSQSLEDLGMKSAFDIPAGSANFDGMAARTSNRYLYLSKVFHKTFFALDEASTEAAAATAVVTKEARGIVPEARIPEIHVDHPFLFAIQHVPTGTCLFLGRMNDPR
jgi:serpin B